MHRKHNCAPSLCSTTSSATQPTYVDQTLGFSLQFPKNWVAKPHTSLHKTGNADVIFTNTQLPGSTMEIGVTRSLNAAALFAQQGRPTLKIGRYPAFQTDTAGGVQVTTSCLGRTILARNDIVTASWCGKDASIYRHEFERILATYQDHNVASA
jgi:hypothetical protein